MGYTHYHTQQREFTQTEWADVTAATVKIKKYAKTQGIPLDDESNKSRIFLNGVGDDGHETLFITRQHNPDFAFCKTALKPYDLVVCMVILACNHNAPGALEISSDGDLSDWKESIEAYKELFGVDPFQLQLPGAKMALRSA